MTTCREFFTFSWPLRGRGRGGRPKRSAWPLFSRFFFDYFPYYHCCLLAWEQIDLRRSGSFFLSWQFLLSRHFIFVKTFDFVLVSFIVVWSELTLTSSLQLLLQVSVLQGNNLKINLPVIRKKDASEASSVSFATIQTASESRLWKKSPSRVLR